MINCQLRTLYNLKYNYSNIYITVLSMFSSFGHLVKALFYWSIHCTSSKVAAVMYIYFKLKSLSLAKLQSTL